MKSSKKIKEFWIEKIDILKEKDKDDNYEEILTYIAYKTLKIASKYK